MSSQVAAATRLPLSARVSAAGGEFLTWVERRVGLTPGGQLVLFLAALGWFLARVVGSRALFLLSYGLVVVLGVSWSLGRRKLAVEAERSEFSRRVREGQLVEVELALTPRRRLSTIILQEELHEHLGANIWVPIPLLPAGEEVTHTYSFTPRLRGVYKVGPLVASWSDPFGLTRQTMELVPAEEMLVHPTTEIVQDRVLSREWEDPPIRPPISKPWPTGFELYGMREYAPGDDPRRIVWRQTAKHLDPDNPMFDRYMVREAEQGITDRVTLILDTDAGTHSPGEASETFETAVRTVASLAVRHLKDGFGVTIEAGSSRLVEQARGAGKRVPALDQMARVRRDRTPLSVCLQRLLMQRRTDTHMVIVSPHLDNDAASRIRLLVDRGVSVLFVLVIWQDTDPVALHRAGMLPCNIVEVRTGQALEAVFRKVVAAGIRKGKF